MAVLEQVNDKDFKEKVINSSVPVIVDFFADWCMPCKMIEPSVEQLAQNFAGKLNVYKVNLDDNPMIAATYHVMSIPTLLIFKNGAPVSSIVGAAPYKVLEEKVRSVLEE